MSVFSLRTRQKIWQIGLVVGFVLLSWVLQQVVLSNFVFQGVFCNLLTTITILWGFVFGTKMPPILPDDLVVRSTKYILIRQFASGSLSGLLLGAFVAAIYSSALPVYPICYPIIGWIAGYFSLRKLNPKTMVCIPLVLLSSVLAEFIMAFQLLLAGHNFVFQHLAQIALPEALLNALIAPFVYFPMVAWRDFLRQEKST